MNSKKIVAFGVGAISVAALTFSAVGPATALEVPGTGLTSGVCQALPASITTLASQLLAATGLVGTSNTDLGVKQAALSASIADLIPAVVNHIKTVNDGGNVAATAGILAAKSSVFSDKVVAANNAMTANFEAQRSAYLTGLNQNYVTGVKTGLCV